MIFQGSIELRKEPQRMAHIARGLWEVINHSSSLSSLQFSPRESEVTLVTFPP